MPRGESRKGRDVAENPRAALVFHWGGYSLGPAMLEFWQGRRSRLHDRIAYVRVAGGWRIERLAPTGSRSVAQKIATPTDQPRFADGLAKPRPVLRASPSGGAGGVAASAFAELGDQRGNFGANLRVQQG